MERQAFLENLSQSGLLSKEQFAEVSAQYGDEPVQHLASSLVEAGRLTSYQVRQLMAGKSKGLVLGQYRILEELGRGGYGCVYKARHNLMERVVALKVITPELVQEPRARAWFRREVLAATQLSHPNIAMAYDADEVDDILFFAMEFIDGPNLDILVREQGPLPIGMAAEMMQQCAKALQYAHEKGMVHRDVKPANILIPRGGVAEALASRALRAFHAGSPPVLVKVVDFGLARLQSSSSHSTLVLQNEKSFVGTPAYVAPEQARNVHDADIRSDLYSLGCSFYFALTGRPPFQEGTVLGTIAAHLEKEADPLERYRPEIPPALASIIRRLMAKKPEKRFQSPAELLSELGFFYGLGGSMPNLALPAVPAPAPVQEQADEPSLRPNEEVAARDLATTRVVPDILTPSQYGAGPGKRRSSGTVVRPYVAPPDQPTKALVPANTKSCAVAGATVSFDGVLDEPAGTATQVLAPDKPAQAPDSAAADLAFINLWRQWTDIIDAIVGERSLSFADTGYRSLQRQLLEACRSHAAHAGLERRGVFQKIADLVQPWLTLQTLTTIDHETLVSLSARCRQIDAEMGIVRRNLWPWAIAGIVAVAAGLGWLVLQDAARVRMTDLPSVNQLWQLVERHPFLSLAGLVPVVVSAALFFLKRVLRA